MTFLYFWATTFFIQILTKVLKILVAFLIVYLLYKLICQLAIRLGYNKITRIIIYGKKELTRRHSVPTGYSEGYYRTEHYKYVNKHEGTKYRARVYFGKKLFVLCSFKDSDKLFQKLLNDEDISLDNINSRLAQK